MNAAAPRLHIGVAEAGKLAALAGDHEEALRHYREAMRLAGQAGESPVFQRHYLECALESLEAMGAHAAVLDTCEAAIRHYADHPPEGELARADLASFHQRLGVALLRLGRREDARAALQAAGALPLSRALLGWIQRGWSIDARRLREEQLRCDYFVVTAADVRRERAIPLSALGI